ncbi:hypothetical protein Adt_35583 [Abeliophyllum distichum]|uniref:Uncharacterized protein n=1 Tax=Abeliophyllum distichum TaxID=126358 RepID=A0ABD1QGH1_9LAMI
MVDCGYRQRRWASSLSKKFSNVTSKMDIDDIYFDDPDSNYDTNKHLLKVSTTLSKLFTLMKLKEFSARFHIQEAFANNAKLFDLTHSERVWIMKPSSSMRDSLIQIKDGKVIDKRETLPPRLLVPNMEPILASIVLPAVEVVGGVSSSLSTLRTMPLLVANVLPIIEAGDDSSSLSPVVEVMDDSSSLFLSRSS